MERVSASEVAAAATCAASAASYRLTDSTRMQIWTMAKYGSTTWSIGSMINGGSKSKEKKQINCMVVKGVTIVYIKKAKTHSKI